MRGPGERFAHVCNAHEGEVYFQQGQENVVKMLTQRRGLSKRDAQTFVKNNCNFIVKRLKYDDVDKIRVVECSCVIMAA